MAGSNADFDAAAFRADLRAVMTMGLPVDAVQRPTFAWDTVYVYDPADLDLTGAPRSFTVVPTSVTTRAPVQRPCTVITKGGEEDFTVIGELNEDEAVVMLFDVDYAVVGDFDEVLLSGNRYRRVKELNELALFNVGLHLVLVRARDES